MIAKSDRKYRSRDKRANRTSRTCGQGVGVMMHFETAQAAPTVVQGPVTADTMFALGMMYSIRR